MLFWPRLMSLNDSQTNFRNLILVTMWRVSRECVNAAPDPQLRQADRQFDCACPSARLRRQKKSGDRCVGRSRGGITTKFHARVDSKGRPVRLLISPGNNHDITAAEVLLDGLHQRAIVIADKGYDADVVRAHIRAQGAVPNIPNKSNRKKKFR